MDWVSSVLASLAAAAIAGIIVWIWRNGKEHYGVFPPGKTTIPEPKSYKHLKGNWHLYYITRDASISNKPIWLHGRETLKIADAKKISGKTRTQSKNTIMNYTVLGEIRHGSMILTDTCIEDETDFACVFFPDLSSQSLLIGIWVGFDRDIDLIAGPVIFSRQKLKERELNAHIKKPSFSLVRTGSKYTFHSFEKLLKKKKQQNPVAVLKTFGIQ